MNMQMNHYHHFPQLMILLVCLALQLLHRHHLRRHLDHLL
jgi:hypothetical protein